jgi:hypothetical protein
MIHALKTWPLPFELVRTGVKRFEYRRNDRPQAFVKDDVLVLREFDPGKGTYTGR